MARRPWTAQDRRILRRWYPRVSNSLCATILGRSKLSIRGEARKLGLRNDRWWSAEERQYLRDNYQRLSNPRTLDGRLQSQGRNPRSSLILVRMPIPSAGVPAISARFKGGNGLLGFGTRRRRLGRGLYGCLLL